MNEQTKRRLDEQFGKVGFEKALPGMDLVEVTDGRARVRLTVTDALVNVNGTLHGGVVATLVDVVGTVALMAADRDGRSGVSTDLNVSWFAPGPKGASVLVEATVLKIGKTLGFVTVDLRRESDGVLMAQGRMTKYMG